METESQITTNPEVIRQWAENRGGNPSIVKHAEGTLLRIDFPGFSGEETLEHISWDEFFRIFEEKKLAFLYQEETAEGTQSRFCKFIDRES